MQQSHATTEPHNEQTLFYAPVESVTPPEHVPARTGAVKEQCQRQEQSVVVEKLLALLEQDRQKQQKWGGLIAKFSAIYLSIVLLALPLVWLTPLSFRDWSVWLEGTFALYALGVILGALFLDQQSASELAQVDDVRCVSALIDVYGSQGAVNYRKKTRDQAQNALIRLLTRVKASDAPLIKEQQRVVLRDVLIHACTANSLKNGEIEFTLAVLKAFEQIGDWKSAPTIRTLTSPAYHKRVRAAAKECLPALQALADKQKLGENLLRASSASSAACVAPATLLRAAGDVQDTRTDQLLRASKP